MVYIPKGYHRCGIAPGDRVPRDTTTLTLAENWFRHLECPPLSASPVAPSASGFLRTSRRARARVRKSGYFKYPVKRARAVIPARVCRVALLNHTVISRHNVSLVMIARRRSNYANARPRRAIICVRACAHRLDNGRIVKPDDPRFIR